LKDTRTYTTIKSKKLYVTEIQQLSNMYSTIVTYKWHFYRATLCVSAVVAVARCMSVCSVCPSIHLSVCLSRSHIVSRWLKISSNFFVDPVAHHSSFLWRRAPVPNSKGNPSSGGAKYTWVGKL